MKDKKKLIIIITCITLGLLALILLLTSCNKESDLKETESHEVVQLNSLEKLNRVILLNGDVEAYDSSQTNITVEEDDCAGYVCATDFTFTKNIDKQKAIEALKPYMVFYDGKPVHTDSNIVVNVNGNRADISCTFPNGKVYHVNSGITEVDSKDGVEFAACTPYRFFRYACVIDKSTCPSGYDVNKTPYYANTAYFHNLEQPTYNLNYNDSLQEENEIWSDSIVRTGNGKYHTISANVRILNNLCVDGFVGTSNNNDSYQPNENTNQQMKQQFPESEAPDINNPDNPNYNNNPEVINNGEANVSDTPSVEDDVKSFGESIKQGFEDFKTNVENNTTFRTVTICVSSVIGIALIYVVYLIIRKLWHVIKN